jgi:hypothetical protein
MLVEVLRLRSLRFAFRRRVLLSLLQERLEVRRSERRVLCVSVQRQEVKLLLNLS